jgi:hypothetical protein
MPTETIGSNTTDTYGGSFYDSEMYQGSPTGNFQTASTIETSKFSSGEHRHLIITCDLSVLPGGITVSAARLRMQLQAASGANHTISVRQCLRTNDAAGLTWNQYSSGNNWTTAGGLSDGNDRSSTVSSAPTIGTTTGTYLDFTGLATLVQSALGGVLRLHLERTDAADDSQYRVWHSSQASDGARPYLEVTYGSGNPYYYYAQL